MKITKRYRRIGGFGLWLWSALRDRSASDGDCLIATTRYRRARAGWFVEFVVLSLRYGKFRYIGRKLSAVVIVGWLLRRKQQSHAVCDAGESSTTFVAGAATGSGWRGREQGSSWWSRFANAKLSVSLQQSSFQKVACACLTAVKRHTIPQKRVASGPSTSCPATATFPATLHFNQLAPPKFAPVHRPAPLLPREYKKPSTPTPF